MLPCDSGVRRHIPSPGRPVLLTAVVPALSAMLLAGCDTSEPDLAVVRDSAGITIVEHAPDAMERVDRWATAEEPALRIGVADGASGYQFFRIADATRLEDGRIVVVDEGARQLRLYDPSGAFLTAHGRDGEGPGEYRRPVAIWPVGDSLAVYDAALQRVTVLSDRLAFARTISLTDAGLGGGVMVQSGELAEDLVVGTSGEPAGGIVPLHLWRVGRGDPPADSLLTVPGMERVGRSWPIYGWTTRAAAGGERLVVGTGREHEIAEYRTGGGAVVDGAGAGGGPVLHRLIRWPGETAPVTDEDWEAYFRGYVVRTRTQPEGEAGLRASLEDVPVADRMPAYNELKLDAAGNLWVREYEFPWRVVPPETRWTVFGPDGRVRARATLPAGFRPFEIGEDRLLGVQYDEAEVQRLVILELDRRPSS